MADPKTPDSKTPDTKKSPPAHVATLAESLFDFQANLTNLFRQKQKETKASLRRPEGNKIEKDFDFDNKAKDFIDKKLKTAFTIPAGDEGLDDKTKKELGIPENAAQKKAYDDQAALVEDEIKKQITAIQNAYKPQVERLIETNDSKNFREVREKEWKDAAKGTPDTLNAYNATIKAIDDAIKALHANKEADNRTTDGSTKAGDVKEKEKENREKLYKNQVANLEKLKTDMVATLGKLPEDILNNIKNTKLTGSITSPLDSKEEIAANTIEEMNKALVKAQLQQLVGPGCVWASVDPKEANNPLSLANIADMKTGKFRVQDRNYRNDSVSNTLKNLLIGLTGVGLLYLYLDKATFFVHENGSVGWNSKDRFSPDFFTAFQGKNPGKPMYLTIPVDMTKEYFKQMVDEARTRRPILIIKLSTQCKENLKKMPHSDPTQTAAGKTKADEFEEMIKRSVDAMEKGVSARMSVGEEETSHLHARSKAPGK